MEVVNRRNASKWTHVGYELWGSVGLSHTDDHPFHCRRSVVRGRTRAHFTDDVCSVPPRFLQRHHFDREVRPVRVDYVRTRLWLLFMSGLPLPPHEFAR